MKLSIHLSAACAAFAGLAASALTVTGPNVLGLEKIAAAEGEQRYFPLSVSYVQPGTGEASTVADAVQTATLAEGDELYVYNRESGTYAVYMLGADKKWTPQKTATLFAQGEQAELANGTDAANTRLARGYGFWIKRKDASSQPIYLTGQVAAEAAKAAIPKGPAGKPSYSLVGVGDKDWTLNDASGWMGAVDGDQIRVLGADNAVYSFIVRKNGKWIRYMRTTDENGISRETQDASPVLKAGTAVWYVHTGAAFDLTLPF